MKKPPMWKHRRLRLASAAILGDLRPMTRPHVVRLRETPGEPARDTRVIDAKFTEVGLKRRSILGRLWMACVAVFWAAAIGFLIPPAWVVVQEIGAMFAPAP